MTQATAEITQSGFVGDLEHEIRARIESLSYLPTNAAVAMKFVELGRDLEADPVDYAKVISADSSLSSKMLALANSSWAGVRNKVSDVRTAVNLLGLGTVRTLAISYCITGLHDELKLTAEESEMFWEASLCKAVAAREYAALFDAKLADEAFVAGLFQDFAIPVMFSAAKTEFLSILRAPQSDARAQLQSERQLFRMDHAEVGRMLAEKLELPEAFIDSIAFHHSPDRLTEFIERTAIADAIHVSSLFPHVISSWGRSDAEGMEAAVRTHAPSVDPEDYLAKVQKEFDKVYGFLHEGEEPETKLAELLKSATREAADNTTELVGKVNELVQQAAAQGMKVQEQGNEADAAPESVGRDPLTGTLDRTGFAGESTGLMTKANRYGTGFGMLYVDVDCLAATNAAEGTEFGDHVLRAIASRMAEELGERCPIGRVGGDAFAALLHDCTEPVAAREANEVVAAIAAQPVCVGSQSAQVSVSAGMLFVKPTERALKFDAILNNARKLMVKAREAGGNRLDARSVQV